VNAAAKAALEEKAKEGMIQKSPVLLLLIIFAS
jgi:hypothetical protein